MIFKEEGLKEEANATEHTLNFGIHYDHPKNLEDKLSQNVLSPEDFFLISWNDLWHLQFQLAIKRHILWLLQTKGYRLEQVL